MPRFRTGHRVPLNVYDGDRPIFQAHSEQDAERLTELLNVGERVETLPLADAIVAALAEHFAYIDIGSYGRYEDDDGVWREIGQIAAAVVLASPETPVERPESPTEPPPATGQPADAPDVLMGALSLARRLRNEDQGWEWSIDTPPGEHRPRPHWVRTDTISRSWEYVEPLSDAELAAWEASAP